MENQESKKFKNKSTFNLNNVDFSEIDNSALSLSDDNLTCSRLCRNNNPFINSVKSKTDQNSTINFILKSLIAPCLLIGVSFFACFTRKSDVVFQNKPVLTTYRLSTFATITGGNLTASSGNKIKGKVTENAHTSHFDADIYDSNKNHSEDQL